MKLGRMLTLLATSSALLISRDGSVVAGSSTASLPVNVTVSANCTIATTAVTFTTAYDPVVTNASTDDLGTGTLTVSCTKGAGTSIGLSTGANVSGTQPRMKGPGATDYLNYTLYSDSAHSTIWSGASVTITAATSKTARAFTVYANIPAGQDISTGSYSDTVVATVNF
jgi:spore coat protein U-like protein